MCKFKYDKISLLKNVPRVKGNISIIKKMVLFCCLNLISGGIELKKRIGLKTPDVRKHINIGRLLFTVFIIVTLMTCFSLNVFAAPVTIWEKAEEIMKDVYSQVLGISTIAAVVTAAIALLMLNFSKTDKTVTESRAWLKRIIITWAILNGLGFIMAYITPFFADGRWNG